MTNKIEPLAEDFLQDVWRIEQDAHSHPWAQSMISDVTSRGACHHVLLCDEEVVGYFYAQNIVGEVTLLNIAIDPQRQGQGLGKVLLEYFLTMCEDAKAESVWLEVRESNQKARSLYEAFRV